VTLDTLRTILLNIVGIRLKEKEKKNESDPNETKQNETVAGDEAAERPVQVDKLGVFVNGQFLL